MPLESRIVAFAPNGDSLGALPAPMSMAAAMPLNDLGAMQLAYHPRAPRGALMGQPLELAIELSTNGGLAWNERLNSRFLYVNDGRDPAKDDAYTVDAPGYLKRLEKVLVDPVDCTDGVITFTDVTAGEVLHTLFTSAQARDAMVGITWEFENVHDSMGVSWTDLRTVTYQQGQTYLSVVQSMVTDGWCDIATIRREILLLKPDSTVNPLAADRTLGSDPVVFRWGRDITEGPFRRTWENLADYVYVLGDDNEWAWAGIGIGDDPGPWGRQETAIGASGISDPDSLQTIAFAAFNDSDTLVPQVEFTVGLDFSRAAHMPLDDYDLGSWVHLALDSSLPLKVRIRQLTLTRNENVTAGNVVLGTKFLEPETRVHRVVQNLIRGSQL